MNRYYWSGICREDRLPGLNRIQECIGRYGFIIDYKFFSDLSAGLVIEIGESRLEGLFEELKQFIDLSNLNQQLTDSDAECTLLLSINFVKGTGDLKIEVPQVPG